MDPTGVVRIALENAVSVAGTSSQIAAMSFRLAADAVLLLHLAFILFAVLGAALAARWRWIPAVHLPAAAWGFFVEITGRFAANAALYGWLLYSRHRRF